MDNLLSDISALELLASLLKHNDTNSTYNYYVDKAMLLQLDMGKPPCQLTTEPTASTIR